MLCAPNSPRIAPACLALVSAPRPQPPAPSPPQEEFPMATGLVQSIVDKQTWLDGLSDAIQPIVRDAFANGGDPGRAVKDLLNGVWLGHPFHPVITDLPVGAWTITELLDLVSAATGAPPGLDTASDIPLAAGIAAAVGAALTGITDWSDTDGAQRRMGLA